MNEARLLLDFIDTSPTPFHAAANIQEMLVGSGFAVLPEEARWKVEPGGRYCITRGGSSLLAVCLPESRVRKFRLTGAHTDSPNLRLKPSATFTRHGFAQWGVEVYGGALYNSWLDRDLGLAGRVTILSEGVLSARLLHIDRPLCRVPQLAIHLDREVNEKGLVINAQKHLPPIVGLAGTASTDLLELVAQELDVSTASIRAHELMLTSVEPGRLGGAAEEFLFAPRLDNLAMCYAAARALRDAKPPEGVLVGIALFDNEEVGSESARGATSPFLRHSLERLLAEAGRAALLEALPESIFLSADMAHALHPNYADRHEEHHHPVLNGGPVIKSNANQRYATEGRTAAWFDTVCTEAGIPTQRFVNRTDLACGSTIGPITAANLGIATVDVGSAMLSMHSARELAGSRDPDLMTRALRAAFETGLRLPTGW